MTESLSQTGTPAEALAPPRRSWWKCMTGWERGGLVLLVLAVALLVARPIYERTAWRRAVRLHKEVLSMKGTSDADDWARLYELREARVVVDFPKPLSYFFEASQNRVLSYQSTIRGDAETLLIEAVFQDASTILKALRGRNADLARWTGERLQRETYGRRYDYPEPGGCRKLAEALLHGDEAVRTYVLSESCNKRIQWQVMQELMQLDPKATQPMLGQVLGLYVQDVSGSAAIPLSEPFFSLLHLYISNASPQDMPIVEGFVRAIVKSGSYGLQESQVLSRYFDRVGAAGHWVFDEALAGKNMRLCREVFQQAIRHEVFSPAEPWIEGLKSSDAGLRLVVARALARIATPEAIDALAGVLKEPFSEVQLQAAWSLAALGDPRGRERLQRWTMSTGTPCREPEEVYRLWWWGPMRPVPGAPPVVLPRPVNRLLSEVARGILREVDRGGTIPLDLAPWPESGE